MDPNATLKQIRALLDAIDCDEDRSDDTSDLITLVNALDEWLSNGGFLPKRWERKP